MHRLRLGTRGSPLALAQSRLVATALGRLQPAPAIELVALGTRGDRDLATPLTDVHDPDFFSAELDDALLAGDVDFCVHSLKDLPARRPPGIALAALPPREDPRDVIVWRGDVLQRLAAGDRLRVGTCSLRRQANVADFLAWALPAGARTPVIDFPAVRGPIDARLTRLATPRDDDGALDGVVLALAGLARLWGDAAGRAILAPLLAGVRWMVLPLSRCPAAAGQGVLAVECRAGDEATLGILRGLHDPATAALVAAEGAALATVQAGDRAACGATAVEHAELGPVCFLRGKTADGAVERVEWNRPRPPRAARSFDGIGWQRACSRRPAPPLAELATLRPGAAVFAAYWHALEHQPLPAGVRLWASGVESWRRLAARGFWVEGCGDNLGFDGLRPTLACAVLGLPPLADWTAVTYRWAVPGWQGSGVGRVLAAYDIVPPADGAALGALKSAAAAATHCYWSSAEQYRALREAVPAGIHHACGAGKTLRSLRAEGLDPQPFPSGREWQRWLAS